MDRNLHSQSLKKIETAAKRKLLPPFDAHRRGAPSLRSHWRHALIALSLSALAGCVSAPPPNLNQELAFAVQNLEYPRSLAVLPFANKTEAEGIEDFVRATFYSHLSVHPYRDVELYVVDQKLQAYDLRDDKKLRRMPARELGRLLDCEAVVFGEITEFRREFAGIYSQLAVGASIQIWDTRSGRKIWSDEYVARRHEGGIPLALTDLPILTIRSGLNLRETEKVRAVDELTRYLTSRIPAPVITLVENETLGTATDPENQKASERRDDENSKLLSLKKLTKGQKTASPQTQSPKREKAIDDARHLAAMPHSL
ncbi:MAG: DUF799 family lipoprotein [Desulfobacterales bacterium]|nr:MAG: DUF799 family lipoprotein [Desulfobacterales bacterium]